MRGQYLNCFAGSKICALKCGWLLLANSVIYTETTLFLYSPFTNNVIILPTLFTLNLYCPKATFSSSNPTFPNCVFVVTHSCGHHKFGISTYRNGDNKWRTKILDGDFGQDVVSIVCTEKGVCYIVLGCGKLGAFCVESHEWSWLVDSRWTPGDCIHLVEFNGDLLMVKFPYKYEHCDVFRYDEIERSWIEQKTLGDKALFVGLGGSYLRPTIGDSADLANKIFCSNGWETRVYSLKDGNWYMNSRAYDWMAKDPLEKNWIEPPF